MKKTWEDAAIESLEITETAGGKYNNDMIDSEKWYDEATDRWYQTFGDANKES